MPRNLIAIACILVLCGSGLAQTRPAARPRPPIPVPGGVTKIKDVEYGKAGKTSLLLDVYMPKDAKGAMPAVVWIHGGGWVSGSKDFAAGVMTLATQGYVGVSVEYRFATEAAFPAQIEDCKAAIRFLRANAAKYNIDPDRIGVWGSSAGGHLVAMLGTSGDVKELEGASGPLDQSSRVRCVVDWCGPTDLTLFLKRGDGRPQATVLMGGNLQAAIELARKANPINYVTNDDPPFLIMHGDKDRTVPIEHSELLVKALKNAGVDVTYKVCEGKGHGFSSPETLAAVKQFLDKHLKTPATSTAK